MMNKKAIYIGIVFLLFGVASGVIELLFYGYIDKDGILHDSFFLPFSFLLTFIGILFIIFAVLNKKN